HILPFLITIPADELDKQLLENLKAEWPGILSWMIQGCLEWQSGGLQPPEAVQEATASYLEGEDTIGAWIDECCQRNREVWETRRALFVRWSKWAIKGGEPLGSRKGFVRSLGNRGYRPQRLHAGRGFYGLKIL